ncbi:MAG: DUF3500 domain-containing protein [Friedmanniella sp.]
MPPESMPQLALAMRRLAGDLLDSLDDGQRAAVTGPFDAAEWHDWTYLPGTRPGLRLGELTADQRERAFDLLQIAFSRRGVSDLLLVLRTEEIRRELSSRDRTALPHLDPPYWLRILGHPSAKPWGWRISGHHLLAQATVVGDDVATAPQFFGAEPAEVPVGLHRGFQSLAREQDLARELVLVLDDDQRRQAVASPVAPDDILTRQDPAVAGFRAAGLARSGMDRRQADLLEALVRQYLDRSPAAVADQAWARILDAGWHDVHFTWSGALERGAGHYYAVTGPTFVLEYDNTQDSGNHIHSVWRDRQRDFGRDLLARHYAAAHRDEAAGPRG